MVSRLEMILKELNENGNFRASLISTAAGLLVGYNAIAGEVDERVIAAMGSLLSDAAYKAAEEMELSEMTSMKIKYINDFIICRNIVMRDKTTKFILSVLARPPESDDIEKYIDQLLEWAVENATPDLEKLTTI